jgi:hypothetical protein
VKQGALSNLPRSKVEKLFCHLFCFCDASAPRLMYEFSICLQSDHWETFCNDKHSSTVLPLFMVIYEHSLRRLLSVISQPQRWADGRSGCVNCKSLFKAFKRQRHCHHRGRLICSHCSSEALDVTYFPLLLISLGVVSVVSLRVCVACEDILTSRKKRSRVG